MSTWRAAWLIAAKDLRQYYRDRTGMLLGFLLPIALVAVFGYVMKFAFGGSGGAPRQVLWVVDEDGTERSQEFVELLRGSDMLTIRPRRNDDPVDAAAVRTKIADGDAHHALIIGAGFEEKIAAAEEPELTLVRDPGRTMEGQIIQFGMMPSFMGATEGKLWPVAMGRMMRNQGMSDTAAERLVTAAHAVQRIIGSFTSDDASPDEPGAAGGGFDPSSFMQNMIPVSTEDVTPPDRPKSLSYQIAQSVSGVSVMMLMFGLMACSSTLILERERGTLRRLLMSSVPRNSILLGKFGFALTIGIAQLIVLFAFGELVFGIGAFRDPMTLIVLSVSWAAAATSFGMLIAAWARTSKQADGLATLMILVMAAVGGCWFPVQIANLPLAAEVVTKLMVTYWAMSGFQGMFWNQLSWLDSTLLTAIGVQLGFAVIAAWLAVRFYRARYIAG